LPRSTVTGRKDRSRRLSVSLPVEQHERLMELARENRVSVAWVVREAVDRLLRDQNPLIKPIIRD
jgi:predicted DNA-binding protein